MFRGEGVLHAAQEPQQLRRAADDLPVDAVSENLFHHLGFIFSFARLSMNVSFPLMFRLFTNVPSPRNKQLIEYQSVPKLKVV